MKTENKEEKNITLEDEMTSEKGKKSFGRKV